MKAPLPRLKGTANSFVVIMLLVLGILTNATERAKAQTTEGEWRAYGHDVFGSRYSPLAEINRENVSRLSVAWMYHTGEPLPTRDMKRSLEVTPLMVDNTLYISTPLGKLVALDPVTGSAKWQYDAKVPPHSGFGDFTNRGVSFWDGRIYLATTDGRLIAVNARTGTPITDFGNNGSVENGCVGHACSPGTVLAGTRRSSTGKIGAPVPRLSTNIIPVLVVWITAGCPLTVASSGGDALS